MPLFTAQSRTRELMEDARAQSQKSTGEVIDQVMIDNSKAAEKKIDAVKFFTNVIEKVVDQVAPQTKKNPISTTSSFNIPMETVAVRKPTITTYTIPQSIPQETQAQAQKNLNPPELDIVGPTNQFSPGQVPPP